MGARSSTVEPHEDYGFFGPGSVTWKVWSCATSVTVGFQRAVVIEELDPALVAAVDTTQAIVQRPRTRYDRTLRYFAMVAFGDTRSTSQAADILVKVHSKAIGTEPLSGLPYDANDPHSQLWIHLTAWHSILYAYERYGPGRLTGAEENAYWAECAVAAELQTCDPADVPRTREGIRAYFAMMRPRLAGSEAAQRTMAHLLNADVMMPPMPRPLRPGAWLVSRVLRAGTIATMPSWMRTMGGLRQPRIVDALVTPVLRISFRVAESNTNLKLRVLRVLSPGTVPVVEPVLLGIAPLRQETLTPAEARERYGYDKPAEAHLELRARQAAKVFGEGAAPTDEGLVESEPILGRLGLTTAG
jgi:uncharacterized protein (DUF2236 family)